MVDKFQELYYIFSRPEKFGQKIQQFVQILYDAIGWDKFSAVMNLKYAEVSSHYMGIYSTASGKFSNEKWELNVPRSAGYGFPKPVANIKLRSKGSFDFLNNTGDQKVLELWLNFFKDQCKKNDIHIEKK